MDHTARPLLPFSPSVRSILFAFIAAGTTLCASSANGQGSPTTSASGRGYGAWFNSYFGCASDFVDQRWQHSPWTERSAEELADTAAVACAGVFPAAGSVPQGETAPLDLATLERARQQMKAINVQKIERGRTALREGKDPPAPVQILPPPRPVVRPKLIGCPSPTYPNAAIRAEAKGTTVARLHIDEAGKVTEVALERTSGETREHRLLDNAALEAFKGCTFASGGDAGWLRLSYVWDLKEEPAPQSASGSAPAR